MDKIENNKPWTKKTTYWDMENGEKISKKEAEKHYKIKQGKILKYGSKHFNIAEKQYYCTKQQLRLFES